MMMANDSHSGGAELSAESVAELRTALDAFVRDRQGEPLQHALRRVAIEARERSIHAEQLLIALKDVWYGLPSLRDADPEQGTHLLQQVVSACIRQYYGG